MVERLLFAAIVMMIENQPTLQTFLVIHLFLIGNIYTSSAWSFEDRVSNIQECFNEYWELNISYCLLVFGTFVPNKASQYIFGWVVCAKIAIAVAVNLSFIIFVSLKDSLRKLKVYFLKYSRRIRRNGLRHVFKKLDKVQIEPAALFIKRPSPEGQPVPEIQQE